MLRVVTIGGIVVFAVLAAVLLAHTVGQRSPGQTITGNAQTGGTADHACRRGRRDRGGRRRRAAAQPKSYDARIRYARALLPRGELLPDRDPGVHRRGEARPDAGRAARVHAAGSPRSFARSETERGDAAGSCSTRRRTSLDRAIAVDPTYPDSYVFKGLLLAADREQAVRGRGRVPAVPRRPRPPTIRCAPQVLTALASAVKAGKCPTDPPTTPTTKP